MQSAKCFAVFLLFFFKIAEKRQKLHKYAANLS